MVIPCHNYGRYLAECVESVLAQTHPPAEVLVIDDASTDDTAEVAARFAGRGVRYERVEFRSVWRVREHGARATSAPLVCFVDADDRIAPDYLEAAAARLAADWTVGLVYSDLHHFGDQSGVRRFPEVVGYEDLWRHNQVHAGAVVRREALDVSDAFSRPPGDAAAHEDWWLWRCVLEHGWRGVRSSAAYHYRRHGESQIKVSQARTWSDRYVQIHQRVTLLVPLAGRTWAWPQLAAFLDRQTWPHDRLSIVLGDTSQSAEFSAQVRSWAARCDYADVRHLRFAVEAPGLADVDRSAHGQRVNSAMCRIWRRLVVGLATPWTWTLEDDVIPPDDVLQRLLSHFEPIVDAVCAPYRSRFHDGYAVTRPGRQLVRDTGPGVEQVESSGFGCAVFRSDLLRDHVYAVPNGEWYDQWFFRARGLHLLCDWNCEAEHLAAPGG